MDELSALAGVPLFADLEQAEIERLGAGLRRRQYTKGQAIVLRGDPGSTLYIVRSGLVKVVVTSPRGQQAILNVIGPGDFFGDIALFDGQPRTADVIALEQSELLLLERHALVAVIEESPRLALGLLAALANRLRRDVDLLEEAIFLDVSGRLARVLLRLADASSPASGQDVRIPLRLTQPELAGLAITTRESVNRLLGIYETNGIIRREDTEIVVTRRDQMEKLAQYGPDTRPWSYSSGTGTAG